MAMVGAYIYDERIFAGPDGQVHGRSVHHIGSGLETGMEEVIAAEVVCGTFVRVAIVHNKQLKFPVGMCGDGRQHIPCQSCGQPFLVVVRYQDDGYSRIIFV
jgi:hypothetical protein